MQLTKLNLYANFIIEKAEQDKRSDDSQPSLDAKLIGQAAQAIAHNKAFITFNKIDAARENDQT
ncbi:hypothetical protein YC2023_106936 [Brassica napus]